MVGPADGPALYTVRLGFADGANTQPGQRVFDVRLQGRTVAEGLDVVREAGGPGRAVVREFAGIPVDRDLKLELVPRAAKPNKGEAPVLNWLELRRERVLHVGIAAPSFTVSDVQPQSAGEVEMANRTGAEFLGTLRLSAPDGLGVLPAEAPVKLAAGQRLTVPLQVWVTRKGPAANREVSLQLLRGDGTMEVERHAPVEYLGPRGRVVIPTAADTYVNNGNPATNYGHGASLLVDGGQARMGDEGHALAYLRFPLRVPGRIVSVRLRLHTSPSEAAESNDSGRIYLVDQPWDENALTYANRPPLGIEVGRLGAVARNVWEERPLTADWTGRTELNLVIEPTSTDGASYVAREGDQAPELVVEFEQ
jgi:hypothetical protein